MQRLLALFLILAATGVHAEPASIEEALAALPGYTLEGDASLPAYVQARVVEVQLDAAARDALASQLAQVLAAPGATYEAKDFVCRMLYWIGGDNQAEALAPLLRDGKTTDIARYALEAMPAGKADAVLLAALADTEGNVRYGILQTLNTRGTEIPAETIAPLLRPGVLPGAEALPIAIARMGAHEVLVRAAEYWLDGPRGAALDLTDSVLVMGEARAAADDRNDARGIFDLVQRTSGLLSPGAQYGAWNSNVNALGDGALAQVTEALASDNPRQVRVALGAVRRTEGFRATQRFLRVLPDLSAENRALLLTALADRGDEAVLPALRDALRDEDAGVRLAALEGLGRMGDADSLSPLIDIAAGGEREERQTARDALARVPGEDIDQELIDRLSRTGSDKQAEVMRALAARNTPGATAALFAVLPTAEGEAQKMGYRALGELAGARDLPALVGRVEAAASDDERRSARSAVVAASRRAEGEQKVAAIAAGLDQYPRPEVQAALLGALGDIGAAEGLPALQRAAAATDPVVHAAAVEALASWPDASVREDLLALAKSAQNEELRGTALSGYVRVMKTATDLPSAERVAGLEQALALAPDAKSRGAVLGALGTVNDRAALAVIQPYLNDPELAAEAALAAEQVRRNFYVLTASHGKDSLAKALDGDNGSRWSTNKLQEPGMWLQVDMGEPATVAGVVFEHGGSEDDYPRGYELYASDDPENWGAPLATGEGARLMTRIACEPVTKRYLRVVQTGSDPGHWWSISELKVITPR